jgi:fatty-acyl-CoA synthase
MAAVKLSGGGDFDGKAMADALYGKLPEYAVPLFIRLVESLEVTSTFKSRKVDLRKEAYGDDIEDPIYVLTGRSEGYVPFYPEYPEDVAAGKRPRG